MKFRLKGKIKKNPIIIEGFPGLGLVGTIATQYIIEHLNAKLIGIAEGDEIPAMISIHDGKVIRPISLFYNSKKNILILHVVSVFPGQEWSITKTLMDIDKKYNAKEIISLESVANPYTEDIQPKAFYYTNNKLKRTQLNRIGLTELKEGIILGVTGALLQLENKNLTCFFAETHSRLPDARAAAKLIDVLDRYIGLKIDPEPLIERAEKVESKLREILKQSQKISEQAEKQKLSYVG